MTKEQILIKHYKATFGHEGHGNFMQYILDAMDEYAQQQVNNCAIPDVISWVACSERLPEKEDVYYVYPNKYHYTAVFHKYAPWAGKFTADDEAGYEYEVFLTHWKVIEPPCL